MSHDPQKVRLAKAVADAATELLSRVRAAHDAGLDVRIEVTPLYKGGRAMPVFAVQISEPLALSGSRWSQGGTP